MIESWNQKIRHNTPNRSTGKEIVEAAVLLLLMSAALFWPAVFGGRVLLPTDLIFDLDPLWQPLAPEGYTGPANPVLADQVYQFLPWKFFATHSLARGQLPLWNPYTDAGSPFLGNAQSAIFSPFNLLSYPLPLHYSHVVTAILRLFVAGIFTFLFAREIGLGKQGALLAMVAFTFSGPLIVWLGHPHSHVLVWLPAMMLTVEKALSRRSWTYAIASGLTIGAQFLGGHPETSFHVLLAWSAYALYRAVSLEGWPPSRLFPQIAKIATAGMTGALLAAAQLLPFAEALIHSAALSTRRAWASNGVSQFLAHLCLEWHDWPTAVTALLPQYFGSEIDGSYWFPYSNYVEQNAYVGVLPLALAAAVVLYSIKRRPLYNRSVILFFALLAVVCLGIALHLPLLNIINDLPLFRLAANGRLRMIYAFAVAILAGLGLDRISAGHTACHRITLRILVLLALVSLCLIGLAYGGFIIFKDAIIRSGRDFMEANWGTPYLPRPLAYYYDLVNKRYERKLALFHPSNIVMYLPVLVALAYGCASALRQRVLHHSSLSKGANKAQHHPGVRTWAYIAIGLTMLDVFLVGRPFHPTTAPQHVFPTPDAIRFLTRDADTYRVSGTGLILQPNSGMLFGLSDIRGYETVVSRRYTDLIDRLEGHYRFHFHSLFTQASDPLWDLLNVKYVLTDQELDGKWELVYRDSGRVKVYRNQSVLPRAFVVYHAEVVDSAAQSLERITSDHFDFREKAVLEERPAEWEEPSEQAIPDAGVQIVDYQANRVKLGVETGADGLLVLTDTYAPGWKARLDGSAIPVYVANHAFRAVVVPSGVHKIEFVYQPLSFQIGAATSLVTVTALALIFLLLRFNRAREPDL